MRVPVLFLFIVVSVLSISQNVSGGFDLTGDQKTLITKRLDQQWEQTYVPDLKIHSDLRTVAEFALNGISIDYRHDRIETALAYLRKNINTDKKSKTYGNIFWYSGDTSVNDVNAVEFCMRHASLIWILYKDRLSEKERAQLSEIYDLSIEGITRHNVKLSYTNIILMKIWNLIALGEYYDRPDCAEKGYALLNDWINYSKANGMCEYLSPTYYAVDIENLSLICNFTKNPEAKRIATAALDYIWTDIAVNWYKPSERLGGTHSRDYDRLYGHGDLDALTVRAGLTNRDDLKQPLENIYSLVSVIPPSNEIKKLVSNPVPRFVSQKWGEESFNRASNYTGKNFSIASSEANYFNMDKTPLVISLGGGTDIPVINYYMDAREDYYGFKKILEKSGHMKSLHLRPFEWSVQNNNEVLFLSSSKDDTDMNSKLESVFTIPSDSEIWIDNGRLDIFNYRTSWNTVPEANNSSTFADIVSIDKKTVLHVVDKDKVEGVGIQKKIKVTPGKSYKLRASMKGDNVSLYLNFYDSHSSLIGGEHIKSVQLKKSDYSWNEISEYAPANASSCIAWVYSSRGGTADIFIQDLDIEEMNNFSSRILGAFDFREFVPQKFVLEGNSNLFIKREDSVAVIRILAAYDVSGKNINFELNNDGLAYGALRLTATHSISRTGNKGSVAVWSYAEGKITDDQKFAAFRKKIIAVSGKAEFRDNILTTRVSGIHGEMELTADIRNEKRISRKGMSSVSENSILSVNGIDLGKKILESLDAARKTDPAKTKNH